MDNPGLTHEQVYRSIFPALKKKFANPIGCTYICNRLVSYLIFMRRDFFQAIADPPGRVILILIAMRAMTNQDKYLLTLVTNK